MQTDLPLEDTEKKNSIHDCNMDEKLEDTVNKNLNINKFYKQNAFNAYKQKKIFTIYGNNIAIRKWLMQRGWLEKCPSGRFPKLEKLPYLSLLRRAKKGNLYETVLISKLLQPYPPNFIWQPKLVKNQFLEFNPLRNRVRRSRSLDFSTKVGLIGCIENSHWNTIADVAEISCMPSYKLSSEEDELYFRDYFRLTQSISILVYLTEYREPKHLFDKFGAVPISIIDFSIQIIEHYYKKLELDNTDMMEQNEISQWENFNANWKLLMKNNYKINGSEMDCSNCLIRSQQALEKAKTFTPFLFAHGYRNLWILKPGFQCRGQGIVIMDNFYDIIKHTSKNPKSNYVVQKYIERPFLIYGTKFDIRQFILLTVFDVISIWIYKDCYLRFSSKEFSLFDLGEDIHITNNSIQKKYKNKERDSRLPEHCMWSLPEFLIYLKEHNKSEIWWNKIYPGFKQNIYGCDFMLDEHLDLFLIEINSTPDMSPSTPVTAKICKSALEDLLKVVLDHTKDSTSSTGKFELIYQLPFERSCVNAFDLVVSGLTKELHISKPSKGKKKKSTKRKVAKKTVKSRNFSYTIPYIVS